MHCYGNGKEAINPRMISSAALSISCRLSSDQAEPVGLQGTSKCDLLEPRQLALAASFSRFPKQFPRFKQTLKFSCKDDKERQSKMKMFHHIHPPGLPCKLELPGFPDENLVSLRFRVRYQNFIRRHAAPKCSTVVLEVPCQASLLVRRSRVELPPAPSPLHVSRKERIFPISHRHSMTLFADEAICCPSICLDGIGQRMRGGGRIFEGQVRSS